MFHLIHAARNCLNDDMQGSIIINQGAGPLSTRTPYLLSHKERQPTDSMFKQQRFLDGRGGKCLSGVIFTGDTKC